MLGGGGISTIDGIYGSIDKAVEVTRLCMCSTHIRLVSVGPLAGLLFHTIPLCSFCIYGPGPMFLLMGRVVYEPSSSVG